MFDYLQYLSVLFLILFGMIIHKYEDKYPLENFKRLKTFKFDMVSIMIPNDIKNKTDKYCK